MVLRATIGAAIRDALYAAKQSKHEVHEVWRSHEDFCLGQPVGNHNARLYCSVRWDRYNEYVITFTDGQPDERLYD